MTETNIRGDAKKDPPFHLLGPYTSAARPIVAEIRHYGISDFNAHAYSLDGTHQCLIHRQQGQFYIQDLPTRILPGKEYLLLINSPAEWNITFSEGY